ncbi:GNAT family N-acetyltransferase [Thioclava litoralis]|uniref:GNAT family N-acetyltransferase n=1 Tax=Thioclava litoralis TaxID=3076557 RepID=A0ABZ1E208_9RHOB|nr:GNAT family N-acetyltransferase [Thioclava sp. FTW29]
MRDADIRFHEAAPQDAPEIAALHIAAWHDTYRGILPQDMLDSLDHGQRTDLWTRVIAVKAGQAEGAVVLARHGARLLGFVSYGPQRESDLRGKGYAGEIEALYLDRSVQGRGLGRRLLQMAAEGLMRANIAAAALWVLEANQSACGFYQAMGGEICGTQIEIRPEATLQDRAYGWLDLSRILAVTAA